MQTIVFLDAFVLELIVGLIVVGFALLNVGLVVTACALIVVGIGACALIVGLVVGIGAVALTGLLFVTT